MELNQNILKNWNRLRSSMIKLTNHMVYRSYLKDPCDPSLIICSVKKMTCTKTFAIKFRVYVTAHLALNIDR